MNVAVSRWTASDCMRTGWIFKVAAVDPLIQDCIPSLRYIFFGKGICHFCKITGTERNINCIQRRYNIRAGKKIIDWFCPFIIINSIDTHKYTHDSAYIAYITVCIPATHVTNIECIWEIFMTVQHRENHNRSIRYDMAGSGIFIISEILKNVFKTVTPVIRVFIIKLHDCINYTGIFTIIRNVPECLLKNIPNAVFYKS